MRRATNRRIAGSYQADADPMARIYAEPLAADRGGPLYNAFPYPTKISPETIALFIAAHTRPGDTVFDGFAGSGSTGLAALLCEEPPETLREKAKQLGLDVTWGPRNAVLYEISALGAFIARALTSPPNPQRFHAAASELIAEAERADGWMYAAKDPNGETGSVRYLIWADVLRCPRCKRKTTLWDSCVGLNPARISSEFRCPTCKHKAHLDDVSRITENVHDDVLGSKRTLRSRRPVQLYGVTGTKTWTRAVNRSDHALLREIEQETVPPSVPRVAIPWGDLYRSGYHEGISHLHHFYTRRNLVVFARLWDRTAHYGDDLRDALRFWLLSYNASHATIMSRVVAKSGQKDLVVTSAQPGVLYISGLPVEKNLFAGLRRKLATITEAFEMTYGRHGHVTVEHKSSCRVELASEKIDYVFTDPPFGGNIPYAEVNFINEAWLDDYTDRAEEAIVSGHQHKSVRDYQRLITQALGESYRILKQAGRATVVFHSATAEVWNALQSAYKAAGYAVERASVLNKTQGSFKQVTTDGAVRGDPVLLLSKTESQIAQPVRGVWQVAERLRREATVSRDPAELTAQRLYSRLVTHFLTNHQEVPLDAAEFYRWHAEQCPPDINADAYV